LVNRPDTKVLFTWEVNEELKSYIKRKLSGFPSIQLLFPVPPSKEQLLKLAPDVDIIIGWRVVDEVKLAAKKMKLFINPGTGVKHHIEFFRKLNQHQKVFLINGHGNSYFAAQHAVAMLLSLLNKIIPHHNWMIDGKWRKRDDDAITIPLRGKKIGLLGYGAINQKVHRFLEGFDVTFSILKRKWDTDVGVERKVITTYERNQLHSFLNEVDVLIIAVPETSDTINLIGEKEIRILGSQSVIINVSRGSVVDEKSLYSALKKSELLGAAIDVWYDYQPTENSEGKKFPYNYPFHELKNILLSPHRAASPFSDLKRWDEVIENIRRYHSGSETFLNVVDLEHEY
jgi:phosphoglycerate dehydrogenase-like enzyme